MVELECERNNENGGECCAGEDPFLRIRLRVGFLVEGDVNARNEGCRDFRIGDGAKASIDCGKQRLFFGESVTAGFARGKVPLQPGCQFPSRGDCFH